MKVSEQGLLRLHFHKVELLLKEPQLLLKLATCLRDLFHPLTVLRHAVTAVLLLEWLVRSQRMHLQKQVRDLCETRDL